MAITKDWMLYDLVASAATPAASEKLTFFAHKESTDGIAVTNMSVEGQLPSSQSFLVKSIQLLIDPEAANGDVKDALDAAVLDFYVANTRMIVGPAIQFVPRGQLESDIGGTSEVHGFPKGEIYKLIHPIEIKGGVPFRAELTLGKTAVSATTDFTVILEGELTLL